MKTNKKIEEAREIDKDIMLSALDILRDLHNRGKVVLLMNITETGDQRLAEMKANNIHPDRGKVLDRVRALLTTAVALVVGDGLKEVIDLVGQPAMALEIDMRHSHDVHAESPTLH